MSHDDILTDRLVLRLLSQDALEATEAGEVGKAARLLGLTLPPEWREIAPLARRRLPQLAECPDYRPWCLRAMALRATNEAVGYVNFHGTSTQLNDAVETRCVRQLFGSHADRVAGSSVKSMIGHPQGASGAAGIVTAALAMQRGLLPPTINHRDPDPQCDLDVVPNVARQVEVDAALCNCLGFGSKNSAVVLGRA